MQVKRLSGALGAEIGGVDLRAASNTGSPPNCAPCCSSIA